MSENKKWELVIGIHNGTLMSRDVGHPKEFDTYEEVVAEWKSARESYRSFGYMIWFANVTSPTGEKSCLESNSYR
jgi:hypothetical protein